MATSAERQTGGSVRVTLWILLIVYIFNFIVIINKALHSHDNKL